MAGGRPAGSPPAAAWGGSPRGRASRPPSGRALAARGAVTVQYPEEPAVLGRRARTRHRLLKRPDGAPRCTSCLLCETVCPARCIRITAEDSPDPGIEKRARTFEIDMGLCVFCGHCVEACPVDAIRMDTGDMELPALHRREMIWDMKALMEDS
ncbi:MAG: NADH-quinone oxidoreductase subunit I [Elusimicrobia bacterium]|nr:NADH-quinone oxidoreductase subunit I [Elusimicrobiota bacterium]